MFIKISYNIGVSLIRIKRVQEKRTINFQELQPMMETGHRFVFRRFLKSFFGVFGSYGSGAFLASGIQTIAVAAGVAGGVAVGVIMPAVIVPVAVLSIGIVGYNQYKTRKMQEGRWNDLFGYYEFALMTPGKKLKDGIIYIESKEGSLHYHLLHTTIEIVDGIEKSKTTPIEGIIELKHMPSLEGITLEDLDLETLKPLLPEIMNIILKRGDAKPAALWTFRENLKYFVKEGIWVNGFYEMLSNFEGEKIEDKLANIFGNEYENIKNDDFIAQYNLAQLNEKKREAVLSQFFEENNEPLDLEDEADKNLALALQNQVSKLTADQYKRLAPKISAFQDKHPGMYSKILFPPDNLLPDENKRNNENVYLITKDDLIIAHFHDGNEWCSLSKKRSALEDVVSLSKSEWDYPAETEDIEKITSFYGFKHPGKMLLKRGISLQQTTFTTERTIKKGWKYYLEHGGKTVFTALLGAAAGFGFVAGIGVLAGVGAISVSGVGLGVLIAAIVVAFVIAVVAVAVKKYVDDKEDDIAEALKDAGVACDTFSKELARVKENIISKEDVYKLSQKNEDELSLLKSTITSEHMSEEQVVLAEVVEAPKPQREDRKFTFKNIFSFFNRKSTPEVEESKTLSPGKKQ